MIVTSKINIDLVKPGVLPRVNAVQDDKYSRNLELWLYADGAAWEPGDVAGVVRFLRADGSGGTYDTLPNGEAACTIDVNIVTVRLAPAVLSAPGPVRLSVGLIDGETEINTFSVVVNVQANPSLSASSEGYYNVQGALPASGWTPGRFLGVDAKGNVVEMDSTGGASDEQVAAAVAGYIEGQKQLVDLSVDWANGIITETYADGTQNVMNITKDANGIPTQIGSITVSLTGIS